MTLLLSASYKLSSNLIHTHTQLLCACLFVGSVVCGLLFCNMARKGYSSSPVFSFEDTYEYNIGSHCVCWCVSPSNNTNEECATMLKQMPGVNKHELTLELATMSSRRRGQNDLKLHDMLLNGNHNVQLQKYKTNPLLQILTVC